MRSLLPVVLSLMMATAAHAECFNSLEQTANALKRVYGQVPKVMGIQNNEAPMVLFVSPKTRHWSIVTKQGSKFCVAFVGKDWRPAPVGLPA